MTDAPEGHRATPPDAPEGHADTPLHAPEGHPATPPDAPAQPEPEQVMDLLAGHVPLALLVDLVTPDGPPSEELLRTEGMPDDAWWEPDADAGSPPPPHPLAT